MGADKVADAVIRGENVAIIVGRSGLRHVAILIGKIGSGDGGGESHFGKDLYRDGGAAEATHAVEKMMFRAIEGKIEPFNAMAVGFERLGARIKT